MTAGTTRGKGPEAGRVGGFAQPIFTKGEMRRIVMEHRRCDMMESDGVQRSIDRLSNVLSYALDTDPVTLREFERWLRRLGGSAAKLDRQRALAAAGARLIKKVVIGAAPSWDSPAELAEILKEALREVMAEHEPSMVMREETIRRSASSRAAAAGQAISELTVIGDGLS